MSKQPKPAAEIVPVSDYPAMLTPAAAAEFVRLIASPDAKQRVTNAVDLRRDMLGGAVRGYVGDLEKAVADNDMKAIFDIAHEIRGLAGTAGLETSGKIADGLCKYIDAADRLAAPVETPVVALHIDAIARAASAAAEAKTHGARVAAELNTLVTHKLQAINDSKTKAG
jgi:chemotaxis protein histidine kinase CheA